MAKDDTVLPMCLVVSSVAVTLSEADKAKK